MPRVEREGDLDRWRRFFSWRLRRLSLERSVLEEAMLLLLLLLGPRRRRFLSLRASLPKYLSSEVITSALHFSSILPSSVSWIRTRYILPSFPSSMSSASLVATIMSVSHPIVAQTPSGKYWPLRLDLRNSSCFLVSISTNSVLHLPFVACDAMKVCCSFSLKPRNSSMGHLPNVRFKPTHLTLHLQHCHTSGFFDLRRMPFRR